MSDNVMRKFIELCLAEMTWPPNKTDAELRSDAMRAELNGEQDVAAAIRRYIEMRAKYGANESAWPS